MPGDFFQVEVTCLPRGAPVPFDLYAGLDGIAAGPFLLQGEVLGGSAAEKLGPPHTAEVWASVADRPRYFVHIERSFENLLSQEAGPERTSALAVRTLRELASELFSREVLGALGNALSILSVATTWFTEKQGTVNLPRLGRPHRPAVHAVNVYLYVLALCRNVASLQAEDQGVVAVGAFLHDIGMLGRFQNLADRPNPLTAAEEAFIRQHTLRGTDQLSGGVHLEPEVTKIVRHHHERMEGGGYPDALSGDEITIGARIVAIGSVFNALTSGTPRRRPLPPFEALSIMTREMTGQFDPALLKQFILVLRETPKESSGSNGW